MKFSKILALALAVLAISAVALAGCSKKDTNDTNTDDNQNVTDTENKNDEKPVLSMATNAEFPPFEYVEGEKVLGADIDIANAIADYLGYTLEVTNIRDQ